MKQALAAVLICFTVSALTGRALAEAPRFVIDDEQYLTKVCQSAERLQKRGELLSIKTLRRQLRSQQFRLKPTPAATGRLAAADLYERLRESVFAVGAFYKCTECPEWHFLGSTGFAVQEDGVLSTCCHVMLPPDEEIHRGYLIAADSAGRAYPVQAVLAADTEADTCFVRIGTGGLKPLALRKEARTGERVYCLSHPGGNHFMFTEGMVARVTQSRNERLEDAGKTNAELTRPILFLNVTAEYAPGSSGAPVVDEAGNVVAQVVSLADAGEVEPAEAGTTNVWGPSVPLRFCIAAEEILRLTETRATSTKPPPASGKPSTTPPPTANKSDGPKRKRERAPGNP